jgi:hypothetical protein
MVDKHHPCLARSSSPSPTAPALEKKMIWQVAEHETPRLGSSGRCPGGLPIGQGYPRHHAHRTARPGPLGPDRAHAATSTPHPSTSPASNPPPPRHLLQKPPGPPDAAPPCSDGSAASALHHFGGRAPPPLLVAVVAIGIRLRVGLARFWGVPESLEWERPGRLGRCFSLTYQHQTVNTLVTCAPLIDDQVVDILSRLI